MLATGFFDNLGPTEVAVLIGVVLPLFVALATKYTASATLKGVVLAVLATIGAAVAWLTGENHPDTITLGGILTICVPVFVTSVTSYYGFFKSVVKVDERLAPKFGFGPGKAA